MSKDYYKILGVDRKATEVDIKKAFRKLAHEYHPDKKTGNEAKFKEVNEAYQVLGNKEKRAQYDQFGTDFEKMGGFPGGGGFDFSGAGFDFGGFSSRGGQSAGFDFGDIFGSVFGGDAFGGRRTRKGSDIEVDLDISLKEAAFGVGKTISVRKHNKCDVCDGSGAKDKNSYEECSSCGGTGKITTTILGQFRTQTICPDCQGQGKQIKEKCPVCHGKGIVLENADIKVEIPAGIDNGQAVRLSGQGNSGEQGAPAGDLYVNVRIKPEKGFERDGDNLITEIEVPFTLAVLGGDIFVETIDGEVKLKIPSGTPSGKKFILRNKGVSRLKGRGRGDQIVIVNVEVPTKLTRKQKHLIEDLDKEFNGKKSGWF